MKTDHLASLGAREIPRVDFAARIAALTQQPPMLGWSRIARSYHSPLQAMTHTTEDA